MLRARSALLLIALFSAASYGQPVITGIVNAASGLPSIAPGSLITVFGKNLSAVTASATSTPWPTTLGGTSVQVCGSPGQCSATGLLYVSPTQLNIYAESSVGSLSVTSGGMTSAAPATWVLSEVAPAIFLEGTDVPFDAGWKDFSPCNTQYSIVGQPLPIRGAITDGAGALVQSSNPARPGRYYTIWLTGLAVGLTTQVHYPGSLSVHLETIPVYGYSGTTCEDVAPSFVGNSPQFPGLNQVNFQMPTDLMGTSTNGYPPLAPCATHRMDLTLNLWILANVPAPSGVSRWYVTPNGVQIPVLVQPGDVPCLN
jgi:uncharacterized protein (TIGR03437 family)